MSNTWSHGFAVPRVHAVVYDVADGILRELNLDFESDRRRFGNVYQMYYTPDSQEEENKETHAGGEPG